MLTSNSLRWLVVVAGAAMLLAVAAACAGETVEVPGETVVVEKVVTETVEVPGETVVVEKEVIKTVEVPGETVTKEVVKEVMVPGETVVVEKEVVKTVEVPGETVVKEVVKTVEVPGETVVVEKEVVKTVEVPGQTVVVEKEVVKTVEVPGQTVVVEKVVVQEVPGKNYVTDPTNGKVVSAPQYGGTLTYPYALVGETTDHFITGNYVGFMIDGVNEYLASGDWGIDREDFDFKSGYAPMFALTGSLAESWETPDPLTYIFHIRKGVYWHDKAPMNGRELTANDVVYTYQRNTALGDFTERPPQPSSALDLPWASIEATDKYTVVMKLTEPSIDALRTILILSHGWILPPEVIEQYGDAGDWKNLVGTGPLMLTDYVEGVSKTYTRNPDYWGFDEKYPENRLPYIDQLRALWMTEETTRISALRTGKVDILHGGAGASAIRVVDVVRSLQRTDPDIEVSSYFLRSFQVFGLNMHKPPFDDVRVRHAMQMALDLETINDTYYSGFARWEPMGGIAVKPYVTTFKDFPEEHKQYYRYDPEGAEKLLDEAGYPRGADGVRLKVNYDHRDVQDLGYAEIAASYWADIGVDVTINIYDSATWSANKVEHNYEMSTGDLGFNMQPVRWVIWYRSECAWGCREWVGGIETPELTAAYDAFFAATTEEEQLRAFKEYDMLTIKQHNQIWGPMAPQFQANQPWVEGFDGETGLGGGMGNHEILARLWIDSELKKAMGR